MSGNRTHTPDEENEILSLARLPIPPPRQAHLQYIERTKSYLLPAQIVLYINIKDVWERAILRSELCNDTSCKSGNLNPPS